MTEVGIHFCNGYASIQADIEKLFAHYNALKNPVKAQVLIKKGDKILIKPNLLKAPINQNEPVTTNPLLILAVTKYLIDQGGEVSIGDSPAFGTAKKIFHSLGIADKLTSLGAKIIEFNKPDNKFRANTFDPKILEFDKIINLPKLKVHSQFYFTAGVKNLFGLVLGKRKALMHLIHGDKENLFAEMLIKNWAKFRPFFTIVDAVEVMDKKGPRKGVGKHIGILFSGKDCVAVDRVITQCLGLSFEQNRILLAAKKLKTGQWDLEKIKITGTKKIPKIQLQFPRQQAITFSPFFILKSALKNIVIKRLPGR